MRKGGEKKGRTARSGCIEKKCGFIISKEKKTGGFSAAEQAFGVVTSILDGEEKSPFQSVPAVI